MLGEYSIASLIIMVAVISFLGFMLENTWLVLTKGFFDNRISVPAWLWSACGGNVYDSRYT